MSKVITQEYGTGMLFLGSAVGGAVIGNIAQAKIKFFDTLLGRVLLMAVAVIIFSKAKSEAVRGLAAGVGVAGATGFIKNVAGSFQGFEGFAGLGNDGMGEIIESNGMYYMVNGAEEDQYSDSMAGYSLGAAYDEAIAAA